MTRDELKKRFPNASETFLSANADSPLVCADGSKLTMEVDDDSLAIAMNRLNISDESLLEEYAKIKSVHALGVKYDVSGQAIHNRLKKIGCISLSERFWTVEQEQKLVEYYRKHKTAESFSLNEIAASLSKTNPSVQIKASRIGITLKGKRRPHEKPTDRQLRKERRAKFNALTDQERASILSERRKATLAKFGHPRGMLGKRHSQKTKDAVSKFNIGKKISTDQKIKTQKTNLERYGVTVAPNAKGRKASWKSQWCDLGGQRFFARSSWEVNYARFLEWRKRQGEISSWKHEPMTFWFDGVKRGCVSYKPDFEVSIKGEIEYHEVKGWMDARSRTVLNRMRIYHPGVKVVLIDASRYKAIMRTCGQLLPRTESDSIVSSLKQFRKPSDSTKWTLEYALNMGKQKPEPSKA